MRDRRFRDKREREQEKHRINDKITVPEVLVIGADGAQVGVVRTEEARAMADAAGLDLVEVAPNGKPPVCKILDYGKLKYKERKKAAEARKAGASQTIKEIRVRYRIDKHDLETKIKKAKGFLADGDRVKFQMRFRGREVAYKKLGDELFDRIIELLAEDSNLEQRTSLMGNSMAMTLVPAPGKKVESAEEGATTESEGASAQKSA